MAKQSVAFTFVVFAFTCFLCFTLRTESAVGHEGKQQVGSLVDGAAKSELTTKPQILNIKSNEVSVRISDPKKDSLAVKKNTAPSLSIPISPVQMEMEMEMEEDENDYNASITRTWCIAKPSTSDYKLDDIIQFCCIESGVDCSIIQYGGLCYNPDSNKVSDASVVMNLYYLANGKNYFNCNFEESGLIVTQDPSVDQCIYPA